MVVDDIWISWPPIVSSSVRTARTDVRGSVEATDLLLVLLRRLSRFLSSMVAF